MAVVKLIRCLIGFYFSSTEFWQPDTENGIPEVIVLDPAGHKTTIPVKMRQIDTNRWKCEYVSNLIGLHSVNVFFGGIPVKNSPFGVKISTSKNSKRLSMHDSFSYVFTLICYACLIRFQLLIRVKSE